MKRYFINLTRILTTKSDQDLPRNLNRLVAHIKRHGVKYFYMVAEVSPAGLRHIHSILILDTLEQFTQVFNDLKKSRLKAYIDDITEIPDSQVKYYYRYINKQFNPSREQFFLHKMTGVIPRIRGSNYAYCEEKGKYNFDDTYNFWNFDNEKIFRNDIFLDDD